MTMTNGTVTKTYKQPTAFVNLNADASNTNIRCFLVPEGSYIDFCKAILNLLEDSLQVKIKSGFNGVAECTDRG